jgi:hypothetical protein
MSSARLCDSHALYHSRVNISVQYTSMRQPCPISQSCEHFSAVQKMFPVVHFFLLYYFFVFLSGSPFPSSLFLSSNSNVVGRNVDFVSLGRAPTAGLNS